ncbi:MAG: ATP-NAD kinase family protein, partial [Thermoplasmatota archaeon]
MVSIGFVVNPIAGMGGRVGLKGTDGVVDEARKKGAEQIAPSRSRQALDRLHEAYARHRLKEELHWITASGTMGEDELLSYEEPKWKIEVIHSPGENTGAEDTREFVRKALEMDVDLIVFCGGDGTARDVYSQAGKHPIFGIPSGVKMHSGVFAVDPTLAGELLEFYIRGEMTTGEGEIMDLDEEKYREGDWNLKLFGIATTLYEPNFVQTGKFMVAEQDVATITSEIAEDIQERMEEDPDKIFILGPGGTMAAIGEHIGIDKTHLGVDIVRNGELIAKDCNENSILSILNNNKDTDAEIVVSPIGGQGFFLGRGNLQISPEVVRIVGPENIQVVSVPQKMEGTKVLRVDTGDHELDETFREFGSIKVLTGYRT